MMYSVQEVIVQKAADPKGGWNFHEIPETCVLTHERNRFRKANDEIKSWLPEINKLWDRQWTFM